MTDVGLNPGGGMFKFTTGTGGHDITSLVSLFINGGGYL
jgi:hypothetical protein